MQQNCGSLLYCGYILPDGNNTLSTQPHMIIAQICERPLG